MYFEALRLVESTRVDTLAFLALAAAIHWSTPQMESFDKLEKIIGEARADMIKAEAGNRAAGTRVRGLMQDLKAAAQEVREKILELRDAPGNTK